MYFTRQTCHSTDVILLLFFLIVIKCRERITKYGISDSVIPGKDSTWLTLYARFINEDQCSRHSVSRRQRIRSLWCNV